MARRSKQNGDCPECACCVIGVCCGLAAQTEAIATMVINGYGAPSVPRAIVKRIIAVMLKNGDYAPLGTKAVLRKAQER